MKTGPHARKHRTFLEEEGFDFRECAARRLVSASISPDSVAVHPPDVCCRSGVFSQESAERSQHAQTIGQSCVQCDSRTFEKEEIVFFWWTLTGLDADSRLCDEGPGFSEARRGEMSNFFEQERSDVGETVLRKPGFVFVPPSVVEQNVKRKLEMDLAELPKTASLEQVTDLMREIQQQDVCVTWRLIWPK